MRIGALGRNYRPASAAGLMAHDALGSHARDKLGISDTMAARPAQAAVTSAATFAAGAALPLLAAALAIGAVQIAVVAVTAFGAVV
jgi:VIT1/CCC1 family predicted Fe2+/Mn2+ transporter